jgi:hypothetical protein
MKKNFLVIIMLLPILMVGQNDNNFEVQADKPSNTELQIFKERFNIWVKSINNDSLKTDFKSERMITNFIMFSEDGLMMKDLKFHTVESCKNEILSNLPSQEKKTGENDWIYVTLESQVNKLEMIDILTFLRDKNIDYRFGQEDEFIPQMIKQ